MYLAGTVNHRLENLVIAKIQDDLSQRQISKDLGICRSSLQNIWLKFANTEPIADRPRSGRPMKSTERDRVWKLTKPYLILKVSVITVCRFVWPNQRKEATSIKVPSKTKIAMV